MNFQIDVPLMPHEITGSGAPLVLLPGGLTGWLSWKSHAEILSASRQVVRVQLHNVELGLSDDPLPLDYSVDYEVAAVGKTLDKFAIDQADFAGWSYGGLIALSLALRQPQRVKSLTLIEPPAFWVLRGRGPLSDRLLEEERAMQALADDGVNEQQLVWFTHFAGFLPEEVDPRTLPQWPVWFKHRRSLRIGAIPLRHDDSLDRVHAFEKPVLLVKGEGSNPTMHEIIDILASEFPQADVVTFPGGHAPHILSMQPFLEVFTSFVNR